MKSRMLLWIKGCFVLYFVFALNDSNSIAATCTPNEPYPGASNIGFLVVATNCLDQGKTTFNYYDFSCVNGEATAINNSDLVYGTAIRSADEQQAFLVTYYTNYFSTVLPGQPFKIFRNKSGSVFFFTMNGFAQAGGKIDDINIASYPNNPTVNTVSFTQVAYQNGLTPGPCCLSINPASTPATFKPSMNETATIAGNISSNYPINWTMVFNGNTTTGSGSPASSWDGKDPNGFPMPSGVYAAAFTATSGGCSASGSAPVAVVDPPKQCALNANFGSTANVATGNLSFTQEVFATKSSTFPLSFSLAYNSLDTSTGPLGPNWHHNYEISLQSSDNSARVLVEAGKRHVYSWNGSAYVAEVGDTSVLNSNGQDLTFVDGRKYNFNTDYTQKLQR